MRENLAEEKVVLAEKLVRLNHILKILPLSRAAWWSGVRRGVFPQGVKLGPKMTCWRLSDIVALAERGTGEGRFKSLDEPLAD